MVYQIYRQLQMKLYRQFLSYTIIQEKQTSKCSHRSTKLLEECTEMLILNMAAQWEFLADSTEALEPKDIPHDVDVYISTEETFLDPLKKKAICH